MKLNLALAQIATKLGDVESNLEKHLDYINQARSQNVDLLVFPELSLTGYVLQDLVATVAHTPTDNDPVFKHLLQASQDLDLVVGFVDEDSRHRFYIATAYLSGGRVLHVHHKVYLPTYGLFDEGRFFAWGDRVRSFETRFGRTGLLICEDFWHASPPYLLWLDGADIMLFSSASPGRGLNDKEKLESARWVERVTKAYASMFTSFVAHANRVGYEQSKKNNVATWEQVQHQRGHFRKWEPDTALFVDTLNSFGQNYSNVLQFVRNEDVVLCPLADMQLIEGRYHA